MTRLVAFGCSHTYGDGLPDCVAWNDGKQVAGTASSKHVWAQLLADKLGIECVNLSEPGSSNYRICMKIINHAWQNDDIAVILWSYPQRDTLINDDGKFFDVRPILMSDMTVRKYFELHSNNDMQLKTWMHHDHAALFLAHNNIAFVMGSITEWNSIGWTGKDYRRVSRHSFNRDEWLDVALDNGHAGPLTHAAWAEEFYESFMANETKCVG